MIEVTEERYFPYAPSDVFSLVAGVASYPSFVPGVIDATVKPLTSTSFHADLTMGYQFFREDYSCVVHLTPSELINIEYIQGPFEQLQNSWTFSEEGQGTRVRFHMAFAFRSALLKVALGTMFEKVVASMIGAFEQQAAKLFIPVTDVRSEKPQLAGVTP